MTCNNLDSLLTFLQIGYTITKQVVNLPASDELRWTLRSFRNTDKRRLHCHRAGVALLKSEFKPELTNRRMQNCFPVSSPAFAFILTSSSSSWPTFNCVSSHSKVLSTELLVGLLSCVMLCPGFILLWVFPSSICMSKKKKQPFFLWFVAGTVSTSIYTPPHHADTTPPLSPLLHCAAGHSSTGGPWGSSQCSLLEPFMIFWTWHLLQDVKFLQL